MVIQQNRNLECWAFDLAVRVEEGDGLLALVGVGAVLHDRPNHAVRRLARFGKVEPDLSQPPFQGQFGLLLFQVES